MIFRLDKIALRWMVVLAFACATSSAAVEADSVTTSVTVNSAQKLSPFGHLGHNMLLSVFGWPAGHSMTNAAMAMSIASYNRDKQTPPKVTIAPLFYDDTKGAVLSVRI